MNRLIKSKIEYRSLDNPNKIIRAWNKTKASKKSATGLLKVFKTTLEGDIVLHDKVSWAEESKGLLKTIYKDGNFHNETTLTQIKERLK